MKPCDFKYPQNMFGIIDTYRNIYTLVKVDNVVIFRNWYTKPNKNKVAKRDDYLLIIGCVNRMSHKTRMLFFIHVFIYS